MDILKHNEERKKEVVAQQTYLPLVKPIRDLSLKEKSTMLIYAMSPTSILS